MVELGWRLSPGKPGQEACLGPGVGGQLGSKVRCLLRADKGLRAQWLGVLPALAECGGVAHKRCDCRFRGSAHTSPAPFPQFRKQDTLENNQQRIASEPFKEMPGPVPTLGRTAWGMFPWGGGVSMVKCLLLKRTGVQVPGALHTGTPVLHTGTAALHAGDGSPTHWDAPALHTGDSSPAHWDGSIAHWGQQHTAVIPVLGRWRQIPGQ